jgi:hypothetical protein
MVGSLEGGKVGKILYEYFLDNCKIDLMRRCWADRWIPF